MYVQYLVYINNLKNANVNNNNISGVQVSKNKSDII